MHKGLILLPEMLINNMFIVKESSELTLQFRFSTSQQAIKLKRVKSAKISLRLLVIITANTEY